MVCLFVLIPLARIVSHYGYGDSDESKDNNAATRRMDKSGLGI